MSPHMKRLLGCLLAMGGCFAKPVDGPEPKPVTMQGSESVEDVKTIDLE